jgi:ParB/RepB/Spo0J family partition protein
MPAATNLGWQNHSDVIWGLMHVAKTPNGGADRADGHSFRVQDVQVARIRPEEGLDRKRDRDGHRELQRSIEQFGVLTPIVVRLAPDGTGDYLLIKGQGRTLACRLLGIETIPAIIVDDSYAENEKVQQFLVENVARLKMRPADRALLIDRARQAGEETAAIAKRFGLAPSTVRRLLSQLDGASSTEVAALRAGEVNLATHGVIVRHVVAEERPEVLTAVSSTSIKPKELEGLFAALGWSKLMALGSGFRDQRLLLLRWALGILHQLPQRLPAERLHQLALRLPVEFEEQQRAELSLVAR